MLFPSLVFIFAFLPAVLLAYYLLPSRYRNLLLLFVSILFYAWGGVSYSLILIGSIGINYMIAKRLEQRGSGSKRWLITGLLFNVSVIFIFKYLDFAISNINGLGELVGLDLPPIPAAGILLPLGISFFTFQQMSLLWDIYRAKEMPRIKLVDTALYIGFFPQLVAGPIVRYNDIIDQIKSRREGFDLFNSGIERFILGLFKKIIIANSMASITDSVMSENITDLTAPAAWLGIVCYAFQIYFDFSGYSDMAIGLGRMFGFRILENFNFPYISGSIKEFWRRWHISLSTWFRDYVYIPLGGNRKGALGTYGNLMIVFLLTGFWHGATWSFVFWGVFHGLFLILERLGFDAFLKRIPKPISWAYCMFVVLIGWVFFRVEEFSEAVTYVGVMFGIGSDGSISLFTYLNRESIIILILASLSSSTLFLRLHGFTNQLKKESLRPLIGTARVLLITCMFAMALMYINSGSYNPFIYFRF